MKINAPHGHLEALWENVDDPRGASLLCHPHPQYGGTMHTKALYHITRALNEVGISTLRFNFRGVGTSTGTFDGGKGEKDDVKVAFEMLTDLAPDLPFVVAGFSFGAAVGLNTGNRDKRVSALLGAGLPTNLSDFSYLMDEKRPLLIVQGEFDEFGSTEDIHNHLRKDNDNSWVKEVTGAGHLFKGHYDRLKHYCREFFEDGPGKHIFHT